MNGARLPSAESLRREFATLVFTPDRLAVVKGGPAARRAYFDRVLGAPASRPARRSPRTTSRRSPSATLRCAACSSVSPDATRSSRGPSRWRRSERDLVARRRGDAGRARAGLRRARRRARPARGAARVRRASRRRASSSKRGSTRDLDRGATGLGPAPRRRARRERRARPAPVRLAGRAAARGALAAARRGRAAADAAAAAARRRPLRARPGPPRGAGRARRGHGTDDDHGDAPLGAADSSRRRSWRWKLDRLGRQDPLGALALRASGGHGRRSSSAGPPPSATGSPATPGRRGSPATGRCTSRRPIRCGRSSSVTVPRRSPRSSACPRCASPRGRCPEPDPEVAENPVRRERRRTTSAPARSPPRSTTKTCAKVCKKRCLWASPGDATPARSDTLSVPRKTRVLQAFLRYGKDPGEGRLLGQGHHRARRARAGPSSPRHVHRLDRASAVSTTWSYEIVDNAVDEALAGYNDSVDGDDPPRQLGHRRRPGPRHPGRRDRRDRHLRARGRADEAARRRQVRRRGLQGLRAACTASASRS